MCADFTQTLHNWMEPTRTWCDMLLHLLLLLLPLLLLLLLQLALCHCCLACCHRQHLMELRTTWFDCWSAISADIRNSSMINRRHRKEFLSNNKCTLLLLLLLLTYTDWFYCLVDIRTLMINYWHMKGLYCVEYSYPRKRCRWCFQLSFVSVNMITYEPLHLAWLLMKFCTNMSFDSWQTLESIEYEGHTFFGVFLHAARVQYLVLSKAWQSYLHSRSLYCLITVNRFALYFCSLTYYW